MNISPIVPSFSQVVQSKWTDFILIGGAALAFALAIIASSGQFNSFIGPSAALHLSYGLFGASFALFVLEIIKFGYRSIKEEHQEIEGYGYGIYESCPPPKVKEGGKYLLSGLGPSALIKKFTVFECQTPRNYPCRHGYKMILADGKKIEGELDGVDLYLLAMSREPDDVQGIGRGNSIFSHLQPDSYGCPAWELERRCLSTTGEVAEEAERQRAALECTRDISLTSDASLRRACNTAKQVLQQIFIENGIAYK